MTANPERIKAARKKAGITQKELAERIGTTQSMIAQYESGNRDPKFDRLYKIATALDCPITDLIEGEMIAGIAHEHAMYQAMNPRLYHLESLLNRLNEEGQRVAIERLEDLTELKKHQNPSFSDQGKDNLIDRREPRRVGHWVKKKRDRGGFKLYTGIDELGEMHTIQVDERTHGYDLYCSECGMLCSDVSLNFCSNCGSYNGGKEGEHEDPR